MAAIPSSTVTGAGRSITDSIDRFAALWQKPPSYPKDICAILGILAISAATASTGAVRTSIFGHDIYVVLDGAWRVLNGQRPAVDFTPAIGPLASMITAVGLKLADNSVRGIGYGSALVAAVTGLWTYLLARRRMSWAASLLMSLLLAIIAAGPYPLGLLPNQLSHAMVYNRYGYALLGLVMLECFQEPARENASECLSGGISSGAIAALLLFLKPSYGLVALAFVAISMVFRFRSLHRSLGFFSGLLVTGLAIFTYLNFDFTDTRNTFELMAMARSGSLNIAGIRRAFLKGLPDFIWLALLALLVCLIRNRKQSILRSSGPLALALLLFIGQALLLATNAQPNGYPLNAALAIMLAEQGRAAAKESGLVDSPGFIRAGTIMLLIALVCFLPTFTANAGGIAYALSQAWQHPPESEVPRFHPPHLASLLLDDVPDGTEPDRRSNGRVYVNYVNDGVELIGKVSTSTETVATLDFANPFSYALLRLPARGGSSCMDFGYTFNDRYKPTPEWLFGAADIVMVPKHPSGDEPTTQGLTRNYLSTLQAGFRLCAESEWWQLYKRPNNLNGCPARR